MRYYIIYLLRGKVVQVSHFDEEKDRDHKFRSMKQSANGIAYDDVQIMDELV
jgi:hypothetical protein